LGDDDYKFLEFLLDAPFSHSDAENWRKTFYIFAKILFPQLRISKYCVNSLKIMEKFFFFEVIQKPVMEV